MRLSWLRAALEAFGEEDARTREALDACAGLDSASPAVRSYFARHRPFARQGCGAASGRDPILGTPARRSVDGMVALARALGVG